MSIVELGEEYICDICDKRVHSPNRRRPPNWSRLTINDYDWRPDMGSLADHGDYFHACYECWPFDETPTVERPARVSSFKKIFAKFFKPKERGR